MKMDSTTKSKGFTPSLNFESVVFWLYTPFRSFLKKYLHQNVSPLNIQTTNVTLSKSSAGFTLIEALVAIAILLIAVVGPLNIVSQSVSTANVGKDQVTAYYLGQEAIEYIRNVRDNNILSGGSWLSGLDPCTAGNTCTIDAVNGIVGNGLTPAQSCQSGSCPVLNVVTNSSGLKTYSYTTSGVGLTVVPTTFRRTVSITETIAGKEAVISVTMSWNTSLVNRTFTITERIFNWASS